MSPYGRWNCKGGEPIIIIVEIGQEVKFIFMDYGSNIPRFERLVGLVPMDFSSGKRIIFSDSNGPRDIPIIIVSYYWFVPVPISV